MATIGREDVIEALARAHFVDGVSTKTAAQVKRACGGDKSHRIASVLSRLADDGAVEVVNRTGAKNRYRLADPSEYAPFRAPGTGGGGPEECPECGREMPAAGAET